MNSHSCQFIVRGHDAARVNKSIVPIEVVRLRIPVENNEMICPTSYILNVMLTRRSKLEFLMDKIGGREGVGTGPSAFVDQFNPSRARLTVVSW